MSLSSFSLCSTLRMTSSASANGPSSYRRYSLHPYSPPDWTSKLQAAAPAHRLHIAQLPTPIHPWSVPGLPDGFKMYIKRDDLTGAALSGNKVETALINWCVAQCGVDIFLYSNTSKSTY